MKDYQIRMACEYNELNDKIEKLEDFISNNETFLSLETYKQILMRWQLSSMKSYAHVLKERCTCERFDPKTGNEW